MNENAKEIASGAAVGAARAQFPLFSVLVLVAVGLAISNALSYTAVPWLLVCLIPLAGFFASLAIFLLFVGLLVAVGLVAGVVIGFVLLGAALLDWNRRRRKRNLLRRANEMTQALQNVRNDILIGKPRIPK